MGSTESISSFSTGNGKKWADSIIEQAYNSSVGEPEKAYQKREAWNVKRKVETMPFTFYVSRLIS